MVSGPKSKKHKGMKNKKYKKKKTHLINKIITKIIIVRCRWDGLYLILYKITNLFIQLLVRNNKKTTTIR